MQDEPRISRVKEHAKLFDVDGCQVLAFLTRTDVDEPLEIVLQVWEPNHDEQLRALISFKSDSDAEMAFAGINDESASILMVESGLADVLKDYSGE